MRAFKVFFMVVFVGMVSISSFGEVQFYLFGRGNFVGETGSAADYVEGENDFPVASAYRTYGGGFGLTFGKGVFIGLEGHYNLSGKVTLTDTSDEDTVEINTYKSASGYVTLGFCLVRNRYVRFYVNGGGGIRQIMEELETKTYVSEMGYETLIEPPEKKSHFAGFGGAGLEIYFSRSGGLFAGGRYLVYTVEGESRTMLVVLAGFVVRY